MKKLFIIFSVSWWISCSDVARDNPLDPANGSDRFNISGLVSNFYQPRFGLDNATVILQPGNLIVLTDQDGRFQFTGLQKGTYTLSCRITGYNSDTTVIELNENHSHNFYLDGLPEFTSIATTAHHLARFFQPENIYYVELSAQVNDPDGLGDIDLVTCRIEGMNFTDTLQVGSTPGSYSSTLFAKDLPISSIHELIGKKLNFTVRDDFGMETVSNDQFLTRIIEESPVLVSPIELQQVGPDTIHFVWRNIFVPFSSTFRIDLFEINLSLFNRVATIDDIPASSNMHTYTFSHPDGDYFWRLYIVDEFGNTSSSKEGVFQIRKGNI